MNAFDKIIGYSAIKKELRQISDALKNKEVYADLGVSAPKGLLLYGEPDVRKSSMARDSCQRLILSRLRVNVRLLLLLCNGNTTYRQLQWQ